MGFKFIERTNEGAVLNILDNQTQLWEVHCEFPFDSTRKRMSLLVRKSGEKNYMLMSKGADSIMMPRMTI
jgi:magnesium-transporting ATPase (P-type)